jgi:hypothetical protein
LECGDDEYAIVANSPNGNAKKQIRPAKTLKIFAGLF